MKHKYPSLTNPPEKRSLLIYDGECEYCRRWIARWKITTEGQVEYLSYQELGERFSEIPREQFKEAVHFIEPDGSVCSGAEAVFKCLHLSSKKSWLYRLYCKFSLFARGSEKIYQLVSKNRYFLSFCSRLLSGKNSEPSTYVFSSWVFPRALGVIAAIAVISYWVQAKGLIGSQGILPISAYFQGLENYLNEIQFEGCKFFYLPTLFWFNQSDFAINAVFSFALIASLCLTLGLFPALSALALWVSYLSLLIAGQDFLSFQWDILLIEMSFLTIFFCHWKMIDRLRSHSDPTRLGRWLIWFLLFRLYFESGVVKLQSYGLDEVNTWRDFTALNYHYWSQPLPTGISWYFHNLPPWFHQLSLYLLYFTELVLPFFIIGPRRIRNLAFSGMTIIQLCIILTGNYGFFNLLTIILCIPLIDDQSLPELLRKNLRNNFRKKDSRHWILRIHRIFLISVVLVTIPVSGFQLRQSCEDTRKPRKSRKWMQDHDYFRKTYFQISHFHTINAYGLFRVMTMTRPEIIISGSDDGIEWKDYTFKYKPGAPQLRPFFCVPHMPRLDWQMWFAGLYFERSRTLPPWLGRFLHELFNGNIEVNTLLADNPFPQNPPQFYRIQLHHYSFTDRITRENTGSWWNTELLGDYTLQGRVNTTSSH